MPPRAAKVADLARVLPYRGSYGAPRPAGVRELALPPAAMPLWLGRRPLKRWRYVALFGSSLMLCVGVVRIGPLRQSFWAVWDRRHNRLHEHTAFGRGTVRMSSGRVRVVGSAIQLDLVLEENPGIESICASGRHYAWTRKQGGISARGRAMLAGEPLELDLCGVIDDTAAYYERHTAWRWSAGVGTARDGPALAWNLVSGVNDPPRNSERTVWVDGHPYEPGPCCFAEDLSGVDGLRFHAEAVHERRENLIVARSRYRQPFGTLKGVLPGGIELACGYGVMEEHEVWW